MRKRIVSLILALCMVLSLLPVTVFAAEDKLVTVTVAGVDDYGRAADFFFQLNGYRENNGCSMLERSETLTELAMQRAAEVAVLKSDTTRPDGSPSTTILDGMYEGWTATGEAIGISNMDDGTACYQISLQGDNAVHYVSEEYTHVGVGCFITGQNNNTAIWVVIFGNSTTDTAVTDRVDTVNGYHSVSMYQSQLKGWVGGTVEQKELEIGETKTFRLFQSSDSYFITTLAPMLSDAVDRKGNVVATLRYSEKYPGQVTIMAVASGVGEVELPVYAGQNNPIKVVVSVPDENGVVIPPDPGTKDSGTWGDNITWTVEGTTLTISGQGAVEKTHYMYNPIYPWEYYRDAITHIVVQEGVTDISRAFMNFSILESVTLPDSLEDFSYGFSGCGKLNQVRFPEGITEIPKNAFSGCGFTEMVIPETVTVLGQGAFMDCVKLRSVILPEGVTEIGGECFRRCESLREIDLPESLTRILASSFSQSGLTHLEIPDSVTYVGASVFSNCEDLETVKLPQGLDKIDFYLFYGSGIRSVEIPDSVAVIGGGAFAYCLNLETLTLPASLTKIEYEAFQGSGLQSLVIPDGVKSIERDAFVDCVNLESLIIPATATIVVYDSFRGCEKLTIGCYLFTHAHKIALLMGIPFEILEEEPGTVSYPILFYTNKGGRVDVLSTSVPAGRTVWMDVIPDPGYAIESIYYQTLDGSELEGVKTNGNTIEFRMPACPVAFEVTFINTVLPFVDVKETAYYYVPVMWALNHGITAGVDATHFAPDNACTRAQVVAFLWRAAGCPEPTITENPFVDVKKGAYYYDAVLWAVENGITAGVDAKHFGPNLGCTRGQVVTFLWRACGKPEFDSYHNWFVDVNENAYYFKAVIWAAEYGITSGVSSTHFFPDSVCTRGQIVSFLFRTFYG